MKSTLGQTSDLSHGKLVIPDIFLFKTPAGLARQWGAISKAFAENGYVIVDGPDIEKSTLLEVCAFIGKMQGHPRAEADDGIVNILSEAANRTGKDVCTDIPFLAHTDGHYLEGVRACEGRRYRVGPPRIVVLQCVEAAPEGGESFLIDAIPIIRSMLRKDAALLANLFDQNGPAIVRRGHCIPYLPVFRRMASGRIGIRFSGDDELYIEPQKAIPIQNLVNEYIIRSRFCTRFRLLAGQILIVDNQRVLHGRTKITGRRFMRRGWIIDQDTSDEVVSVFGNNETYRRTYETAPQETDFFSGYGPAKLQALENRHADYGLSVGIDLKPTDMWQLNGLLIGGVPAPVPPTKRLRASRLAASRRRVGDYTLDPVPESDRSSLAAPLEMTTDAANSAK